MAYLLIYDGDCGMCEASARWAQRVRPGLEIKPSQELSDADCVVLGVQKERLAAAVALVSGSEVSYGAHAVNALLVGSSRAGSRVLSLARMLSLVKVEELVYGFIARHRARIGSLLGYRTCAPRTAESDRR